MQAQGQAQEKLIDGETYGASNEHYMMMSARKEEKSSQIVLCGHGVRLSVEKGALIVKDGFTHEGHLQAPLTRVLYKGVHEVEAIVILSDKGNMTIDALNWCQSQNIMISIIDFDGNLKQCLTSEPVSNASLRRKQYLASEGEQAANIAYQLLCRKALEQLTLLQSRQLVKDKKDTQARACQIFEDSMKWLDLPDLPRWKDIDYMRTFEGRLSKAYWCVFEKVELKWKKGEIKSIPPHWIKAGIRASYLNKNHGARNATSPFHALLNYAYACLESKVRQALVKQGFDLACAFLHADKLGRDSLVYDLIELYRSKIDALVLDFVGHTTFKKGDLIPVSDGSVRLSPQLAKYWR